MIGTRVLVPLPDGWLPGTVHHAVPRNQQFDDDPRVEVHGDKKYPFISVVRVSSLLPEGAKTPPVKPFEW